MKAGLPARIGAWPFSQADRAFSGAQETIYAMAARHAYQTGRAEASHRALPHKYNHVNVIW